MSLRAYTIRPQDAGMTLLAFVADRESLSLRKAKGLLDARLVFVNGRRVWMAKHPLKAGDQIEIAAEAPSPSGKTAPSNIATLYDHAPYKVINKPPGLLSNGPESAEKWIQTQTHDPAWLAVHRLDRDTSGCLCLAHGEQAFDEAVNWFKKGLVKKTYHAIVAGIPHERSGRISKRIDGATAVTHWKTLAAHRGVALLEVTIDTGRTHQIRRHLQSIGHAVLGDKNYAGGRVTDRRWMTLPRQMLHAVRFAAPLDAKGKVIAVTAPLPADFKTALKQLGLNKSQT